MSAQPGLVPEFASDMRVRRNPEFGFQVNGIPLRKGGDYRWRKRKLRQRNLQRQQRRKPARDAASENPARKVGPV